MHVALSPPTIGSVHALVCIDPLRESSDDELSVAVFYRLGASSCSPMPGESVGVMGSLRKHGWDWMRGGGSSPMAREFL